MSNRNSSLVGNVTLNEETKAEIFKDAETLFADKKKNYTIPDVIKELVKDWKDRKDEIYYQNIIPTDDQLQNTIRSIVNKVPNRRLKKKPLDEKEKAIREEETRKTKINMLISFNAQALYYKNRAEKKTNDILRYFKIDSDEARQEFLHEYEDQINAAYEDLTKSKN